MSELVRKINLEDKMERKMAEYTFDWWEMNTDTDDVEFFAQQDKSNLWSIYIKLFRRVNEAYVKEFDPEGWLRLDILLGYMDGAADGEAWKEFIGYIPMFGYLWEKHVKPILEA